ncbi:hypothetical protein [Mediterraneibacter gnavus]|uniref:hypothetical protein n=1 Tax=Mediterraneibacter gnavus TaxID=33038 RepID=UPI003565673C
MYTKEQNAEIEKVCRVFADYIKENSYFDVVWSEKLGYIYFDAISPDKEDIYNEPIILRSGRGLCKAILYNIIGDIMEKAGGDHETFSECTETEREKVRKVLQPFMNQLPAYMSLMEEIFMD